MIEPKVLSLLKDLISRPSITPNDAGCQELLIKRLESLGFVCERMIFEDTTNLWARRGTEKPLFCFAGHTDVVPPGPLDSWDTDPFKPTIIGDMLYGRGACDMKAGLAAFMIGLEQFIKKCPDHNGSIALLITSDEEEDFINGTTRVIDTLEERNEKIDLCIVGEPSSTDHIGDFIKNGRRGSLTCDLIISGKQGHVAYPEVVQNPIHLSAPFIAELTSIKWDQGNEYFPPTSLQITNFNSGTGACNMVPSDAIFQFNLRYSTELTSKEITDRVEILLKKHSFKHTIKWTYNGSPFITEPGLLTKTVTEAIFEINGIDAKCSTSGGTSDARFIGPTGAQVIELGPINKTIHKPNESVSISQLTELVQIYELVLFKILC